MDKEEPKQETLEEVDEIEKIAMDKLKSKWEHLYIFGYPQKPFPTNYENDLNMVKIGLYEGAKWQQERMYSEEEVGNIANWAFGFYKRNDLSDSELEDEFNRILVEQFKKK